MIRYAVVDGGYWSDVATWDGGTTLPTVGDEVYANGNLVNIDQLVDVSFLSNRECPTTSTSGGYFYCRYTTSEHIINADIYGGGTAYYGCIYIFTYSGSVTIVGDVYGSDSTAHPAIYMGSTSNFPDQRNAIQIIGNVYGGTYAGAYTLSNRTDRYYHWTIVGNCYGMTGGILNKLGRAGFTITGDLYGTNDDTAFVGGSTASNSYLTGNIYGVSANYTLQCNSYFYMNGSIYYSGGLCPLYYFRQLRVQDGGSVSILGMYNESAGEVNLFSDFDQPAEADVRDGVEYGSSTYTGTLVTPDAENVVRGVPVGDTVGTWAFDSEVIQRLLNCSTVAITGQQIASYNGAPAELVPTYEKRYDAVYGTPEVLYLGAAPVGTLDSSTIWDLTKITYAINGSITSELHATDSWNNHLTASYS